MTPKEESVSPTGIPVDRSGGPTVDPTANVIALSAASNVRQDDLRKAASEITALQFRLLTAKIASEVTHIKELMHAESKRVDQQATLRDHFSEELRKAEANRIDAIRSVDVQAVAVASQRAADQASVLQAQVASSAEALRALVASTAATFAQNLQQTVGGLSTRLTTLEQGSYQLAGKQQYSDPEMTRMLAEVRALNEQARASSGKSDGIGASWSVVAVLAGLVIGALGLFVAFEKSSSAPQVVYLPVPAGTGVAAAPSKP